MPGGGGWVEEDSVMLDAITALELEARDIEREAYDSIGGKTNQGSNGEALRNLREAKHG